MRLFQSAVNVAVLAWGAPLFQNLFGISLSEIMIGILIAGVAVVILLWASFSIWKMEDDDASKSDAVSE